MTAIPHASFEGTFAADAEYPHPSGASLARELESRLRARFFTVKPFDNWRDCGWVVELIVGEKSFEAYFAKLQPEGAEWLLAIAPIRPPGVFGRLLGRKPLACEAELRSIAEEVHATLNSSAGLSQLRWHLGSPPWFGSIGFFARAVALGNSRSPRVARMACIEEPARGAQYALLRNALGANGCRAG